ncbi:MAG: STAS domain-containing protein [Bacteriovorax sp.]
MATWKENELGRVDVEFNSDDLAFSNVQRTKEFLEQILDRSSFNITMNDIHDFDSSGLQLLIYFVSKIKSQGGRVEMGALPAEMTNLCLLYGIVDIGEVEKIKKTSTGAGGTNV